MRFKDLKIGMLIERGLIHKIYKKGQSKFFGNEQALSVYEPEDSYYGPVSFLARDSKFNILHEIGSPEYLKIVRSIADDTNKRMEDWKEDIKFLSGLIDTKGE